MTNCKMLLTEFVLGTILSLAPCICFAQTAETQADNPGVEADSTKTPAPNAIDEQHPRRGERQHANHHEPPRGKHHHDDAGQSQFGKPKIMCGRPHGRRGPAVCEEKRSSRNFFPIYSGIKKESVNDTINAHISAVEACYTPEYDKDKQLSGWVGIHVLLTPKGDVMKIFMKETTLNNENVERCLIEEIKTWKFKPERNSGMGQIKRWFKFYEGHLVD